MQLAFPWMSGAEEGLLDGEKFFCSQRKLFLMRFIEDCDFSSRIIPLKADHYCYIQSKTSHLQMEKPPPSPKHINGLNMHLLFFLYTQRFWLSKKIDVNDK